MTGGAKIILLVEDEHDIREALAEVLLVEGYQVLSAPNGQVALDLLRAGPLPFVILLDLMMPVLDGWGFLAARTGSPELESLPVIVMSATDRRRPIGAGLSFLRKPIDLEELLRKISDAYSGS